MSLLEDGLEPWQLVARLEIHKLYESCCTERKLLVPIIQQLSFPTSLEECKAELKQMAIWAIGMAEIEAESLAESLLTPQTADNNTLGQTTVYHWRVDWGSLWRGQSDAQKLCALARSFLCSGYDHSQPICSRDHSLHMNSLRFGDGQKRGLAWRLAWSVLKGIMSTHPNPRQSPILAQIFKSLLQVPTSFPSTVETDNKKGLIEQAVRQNTKAAMQLPLNSVEWCRLVTTFASPSPSGVGLPEDWLSAPTPAVRA